MTADAILFYAFPHPVRLADPAFKPPRLFNEFHVPALSMGKAHCAAKPDCTGCPLAGDLAKARPPSHWLKKT